MKKNFIKIFAISLILNLSFLLIPNKNVNAEDNAMDGIEANSALLIEPISGKILYEKNIDEKYAPASVTKVMTMLLAMEAVDNNKVSLQDKVTCSENAKNMGVTNSYK